MSNFITFAYFRKECDVDNNVEDKTIDNPIKRAQDTLKMILSPTFYSEIEAQLDGNSFTAANQALFDPYIKQFIAWQAYEFWLAKVNFNFTRSGVRVHTDESSEIASDKAMGELIRQSKQTSQFYKGLLMTFLKENDTDYPNYPGDCNSKAFGTGFHITSIARRNPTNCQIDNKKNNDY